MRLLKNKNLMNLLFTCFLAIPLVAVASKVIYVQANKNAYQSYYGETINKSNIEIINNTNNLKIGNKYRFINNGSVVSDTSTGSVSQNVISYSDIELISGTGSETINTVIQNSKKLGFYKSSGNNYMSFFFYDEEGNNTSYSNSYLFTIDITITSIKTNMNLQDLFTYSAFEYITYNNYSYLDNVFEYSVHSLEDNQLFNWTKNTAVYTGVNAMTSNLEIEGSVIPILITYWFLLTIIYVIIDIILKLFTILTHMIGNKTA